MEQAQKVQENIEIPAKQTKVSSNSWTKNVVTDPEAPQYYSQRAVWGSSVFFTVLFGAVLLASNLSGRKAKWIVLSFGILYTIVAILILNNLPQNTGLTLGVNAGGAVILTQLFWNRYLGKETKFRTKPIWKPLIISILITIPFILAIIYGV